MAANPMASRSAALAGAAQAMNKPKQPGGDFRQNLAGATGGTIKGANGGTQQLGSAALRRLGTPGAATGPDTKGGGLNPSPGGPPPGVRTPPIMDPMQNPNAGGLPGFSAQPGMEPFQPGGGSGSVGASTPGDPNAKLSSFGPGDGVTGSGFVPNMPGAGAGPGGSPNMGGAGPQAALIAKLSGAGLPPQAIGAIGSALPGFQSPGNPFGGGQPGFGPVNADPGSTPWMPPGGPGGPNMHGGGLNGDQAPDQHGGGGPLGGDPNMSPGYRVGSPGGDFTYHGFKPGDIPGNTPTADGRPPMNTKPMPGAPGGGIWNRIAGGAGQGPPINNGIQNVTGGRRGMASF